MGIYNRNSSTPGREPNWWVSYSVDGDQQRERAGTDRREAERLLRRRRREVADGTWTAPNGRTGSSTPLLAVYAERWLTATDRDGKLEVVDVEQIVAADDAFLREGREGVARGRGRVRDLGFRNQRACAVVCQLARKIRLALRLRGASDDSSCGARRTGNARGVPGKSFAQPALIELLHGSPRRSRRGNARIEQRGRSSAKCMTTRAPRTAEHFAPQHAGRIGSMPLRARPPVARARDAPSAWRCRRLALPTAARP